MLKTLSRLAALCVIVALPAQADYYGKYYGNPVYEVTITNITKSVRFTPILVATHRPSISFFELGAPAGDELALMAEDGATGPLAEALAATGKVIDTANSADVLPAPPLLGAGESVTVTLEGANRRVRLSMAAMLLPTNDSFMALNGVSLPRRGSRVYYALGYDAGSEPNDEFCMDIPGPTCGGVGASPEAGGEGHVHIANGIHGGADLNPSVYDWRNPVARIVVKRVR